MAGDKQQQHTLHFVVFPWLAFGHLIPFLELSKRLAARGHAVTFVSTPRNIARLPALAEGLSDRVRMVALPLPAVDGLPEGAESTADVPPEKVELLKAGFDGLAAPLADFLAAACAGDPEEEEEGVFGTRPDWIVLDFAHYWLCPIAEKHQIPCAMFFIYPASWVAYGGAHEENVKHPCVTIEDFMAEMLNASGVADSERYSRTVDHCRLLVPRVFPILAELFRKPVVPAGLLLPAAGDRHHGGDHGDTTTRWLDEQPPGSVLYVALGSEAPVTVENVCELAAGLELSGARFLWALRPPSMLPEGFEERTSRRGLVWTGWVPQMRVLGHVAMGAFLTHCGWGSVAESLRFGHPLVMLPFITDQGLIARMMTERGVGVEVARRDDDGWFGRDDVAVAVRRVMVEEDGKVFALNARRLVSHGIARYAALLLCAIATVTRDLGPRDVAATHHDVVSSTPRPSHPTSRHAIPNRHAFAIPDCHAFAIPGCHAFVIHHAVTDSRSRRRMAAEEGVVIACHTKEEFYAKMGKAKETKKLVVIDFTASWCGPSRSIAPVFVEFAKKYPHVVFLKVDIDELREYEIEGVPTFHFVKGGEKIDIVVGANKDELQTKVEKHAGQPA
ncbi:hypothetical protein HU200_041029 [Digitaria exilis]|uniref:Thioredoxin domain-containing protein n=1 Tax=Digitaria exilis TaxID=1010633 RepID=A0A835B8H7_9POAL|nr:hypothetical protein HU200_041029 [Digitaria exilis]